MKIFLALISCYVGLCCATSFEKVLQRTINQEKCVEMGGPKAWNRLANFPSEVLKCVEKNRFIKDLQNQLREAMLMHSYKAFAQKYCSAFEPLRDCAVDALFNAISPCLTNDEKKELENWIEINQKVTDLFCKNEGEKLAAAFEDIVTLSQSTVLSDLTKKCAEEHFQFPENSGFFSIQKHGENCSNYKKVQNCILQKLKDRHGQKVSSSIEEVTNIVKDLFCVETSSIRKRRGFFIY